MKLKRPKPHWLLTLILALYITSIQTEDYFPFHKKDLRILVVGGGTSAKVLVGNVLLERKSSREEDREIVRGEVIENEGRRMMVVTGTNLCEKKRVKEALKRALILSSPGPHAILITLKFEDEEDKECDFTKQIQELLGTEVLQYCVVVLHHQNDPEKARRTTLAWRQRITQLRNSVSGRYHVINDSDPTPVSRSALIGTINMLVWGNSYRFYSTLNESAEQLETEKQELLKRLLYIETRLSKENTKHDKNDENVVLSVIYNSLGGGRALAGWILLNTLIAAVIFTKGTDQRLNRWTRLASLVMFMVTLRNVLSPDVVIPLNLTFCSTLMTVVTNYLPQYMKAEAHLSIRENLAKEIITHVLFYVSVVIGFIIGLSVGTITKIFTASDLWRSVPGVTLGDVAFWGLSFRFHKTNDEANRIFTFISFICSMVGTALSMGCVAVFFVFGVKIIIVLLIATFTGERFHLQKEKGKLIILTLVLLLIFSCSCVFTGSMIVISEMMISSFKAFLQNLVNAFLVFVALRTCCFGIDVPFILESMF